MIYRTRDFNNLAIRKNFTGSTMIKRLSLIFLMSYSVTTYAESKKPQLVIVNVADLQKQYSTSPNTKIEVQSVSNTPLAVQKVVVNRGACLVLPDNKITNLPSYGSRAVYLMGGCYAKNIALASMIYRKNCLKTILQS